MDLHQLATAINRPPEAKTVLIYGKAKTGKSTIAATIAKCKNINNVHWFDTENGYEGLIAMVKAGMLSEADAKKIKIYRIRDSVEQPLAFETLGKLVGIKKPLSICEDHGRVDCPECVKTKAAFQTFDMTKCGVNDCIVVDSSSQHADSVLHYYNDGKMLKGTAGLDCYREQGLRLVEFLTEVQKAKTNWICITHDMAVELEAGTERIAPMEYKGPKDEQVYPLIGTRQFCMKVGKYFGHVAYIEVKLGVHKGGSSTTYKRGVITGSRTGWRLEDQKGSDGKQLLSLVPLFDGV